MMRPSNPTACLVAWCAVGIGWGASACTPKKNEPERPASDSSSPAPRRVEVDLRSLKSEAAAPYIPPQCYTRTQDAEGHVHNPCFTCHSEPRKPNFVEDSDLQLTLSFPKPARENPWKNLFVDRRGFVDATSDEKMLAYVRTDNYGGGKLGRRLATLPKAWDSNHDGRWNGYVPDAGFDFDERGFDRDSAGRNTGWRAYAYQPFPGTFWPTNGSAGDVLIRLPESFRRNERGELDQSVYAVNLAIVEALAKRADVPTGAVDERELGVDLDKDGRLGRANFIKYDWAPREGRTMSYVGRARLELQAGELELASGLFPVGTEFLHSVRYLDVSDGKVRMAARMKELRYARKLSWHNYLDLEQLAGREVSEKRAFPDRVRQVLFDLEHGASNNQGWRYQGFIEDRAGELRPQSYEETAFCVGCHGGTSATTDGIFSFPRKVSAEAAEGGWYHWSQHGLEGLPDLKRADGRHEYAYYLEQNGAGDERRSNHEVLARFFDGHTPRRAQWAALEQDVSRLIVPSAARALALDKAYWAVVLEQSFRWGRDAVLAPAVNVHRRVEPDQRTGVDIPVAPGWKLPSLAER